MTIDDTLRPRAGSALIEAIAHPVALRDAWRRVRRNGGGAGGDGETPGRFAHAIDANLGRLAYELLGGTYRPRPLRRYPIAKASGGLRWLAVPSVRDRVAQTAAATVLAVCAEPVMSPASFAYRGGRSIEHALGQVTANRLAGFRYVVDGDIADFFPSIRHRPVLDALAEIAACRRTLALVSRWLAGFSWTGQGLAQGSPLSPVLSNLALAAVDRAIQSRRVRLVRYADDFLLMTRTRSEAEVALHRYARLIAPIGLALNPGKTRVAALTEGVSFLGFQISGDRVTRADRA